jgi:hypothetical protein
MATEIGMNFEYTRTHGLKRTYLVTLDVTQTATGEFGYEAWVQHGEDFKGNGLNFPLTASNRDAAMMEAQKRIEQDIEDLAGIDE